MPARLCKLVDVPHGVSATLAKIKLDDKEVARLEELGLRRGAPVRIYGGGQGESILIGVSDARVGVNYAVADRIYVHVDQAR